MAISHDEVTKLQKRAVENRDDYWENIAEKLVWTKRWDKVCDVSQSPRPVWFPGGELNLCYNCVDRHIKEGYGDLECLFLDSPFSGIKKALTYHEILEKVSKLAGVLKSWGVKKGDRVLIYLPLMLEGAFAMLACARIGALHCAQPSGLPAQDLAIRIDHAKPKVILTASHGYHGDAWLDYKKLIDEARNKATHKVEKYLVYQRRELGTVTMEEGLDEDWEETLEKATPADCVPMESTEPLFVIYTSGSTGAPKAIVHAVGGFAVRLHGDGNMLLGYGNSDEMFLATSNFGWVVGVAFMVYMPLILKLKCLYFEGDPLLTSDVHTVYKIITDYKITRSFIRPGILKIIKGMDPEGKIASQYSFKNLKMLFIGGERIDLNTVEWMARTFDTCVWNLYGQSEVAGVLAGIPDAARGKSTHTISIAMKLFPGWNTRIMRSDNTLADVNEIGRILIKLPLPPGGISGLLDNESLYKENYFSTYPGYYDTKDDGYMDEDGNIKIECRADDIMKHASVYLAAQAVEEVVMSHPGLSDCCVVGVPHLIYKELPTTLYVTKQDINESTSIISSKILKLISEHFGEAVTFGPVIRVDALPQTRTGKIHRPSILALARGNKFMAVGAVENPEVFPAIEAALKANGCESKEAT